MSDELPLDLQLRIERDLARHEEIVDRFQTAATVGELLTEWARDLQAAKECARDGGGICPRCGGYAKRVEDHEGSPNSLWKCTKCHEGYYTFTDFEASSYRALKKFTREFLGFVPGAFPKQFKEWARQHNIGKP